MSELRQSERNLRRCGVPVRPWPIDEPEVEKLIDWVKRAARDADSPAAIARLVEGYAGKRDLLHYQFVRMFGFRPDSHFEPGAGYPAIRQYMLENFFHIERFVNHLCLDPEDLSPERLLAVWNANRSVFQIFLDQLGARWDTTNGRIRRLR